MKKLTNAGAAVLLFLIFAIVGIGWAVTACSSAQRAEEKAALQCIGNEFSQVEQILSGSGSTGDKVVQITPAVWQCAQQISAAKKVAPGSGSGH